MITPLYTEIETFPLSEQQKLMLEKLPEITILGGIKSGHSFDLITQGRGGGKSMLFCNEFVYPIQEYKLMKSKSKQSRYICVRL